MQDHRQAGVARQLQLRGVEALLRVARGSQARARSGPARSRPPPPGAGRRGAPAARRPGARGRRRRPGRRTAGGCPAHRPRRGACASSRTASKFAASTAGSTSMRHARRRARAASTAARSASNSGASRWQWVSIQHAAMMTHAAARAGACRADVIPLAASPTTVRRQRHEEGPAVQPHPRAAAAAPAAAEPPAAATAPPVAQAPAAPRRRRRVVRGCVAPRALWLLAGALLARPVHAALQLVRPPGQRPLTQDDDRRRGARVAREGAAAVGRGQGLRGDPASVVRVDRPASTSKRRPATTDPERSATMRAQRRHRRGDRRQRHILTNLHVVHGAATHQGDLRRRRWSPRPR